MSATSSLPSRTTSFGAVVKLVAVSRPLMGDGNPKRLPILAVKTSVGKVAEKGVEHYLTNEWKEAYDKWIESAKDEFPNVLEHVVLTFHVDGCSRVCSHQFVRHRLATFTQESQRYTEARIVKAIAGAYGRRLDDLSLADAHELAINLLFDFFTCLFEATKNGERCKRAREVIEKLFVLPPTSNFLILGEEFLRSVVVYLYMRKIGAKMEDARFVLPQAIRTSLLVTANLREWMHIVKLRAHPKAQWEIREVAEAIADLIEEHVGISVRQLSNVAETK